VLKAIAAPALEVNETAGEMEIFFNGSVKDIFIAGVVFMFI
jgi:hypothetical protein